LPYLNFHYGFIPIHLRLDTRIVSLRNESFAARFAVGQFQELNILTRCAFSDRMSGEFITQPHVDAMCGMPRGVKEKARGDRPFAWQIEMSDAVN
jgi:hypothetical protein